MLGRILRVTAMLVLAAGLGTPAGAAGAPPPPASGLPPGATFTTLQFNLCNSGVASCYSRNQGRSVSEAAGVILARRPDVVTVNEVCRADVTGPLAAAMEQLYPREQRFVQFQPAGNRSTGGAYKCKNGDDYGIGVLGRVPGASGVTVRTVAGLYPQQDTSSNEMRAYVCAVAGDVYAACTTHLVSTSGTIALQQCRHLMGTVVPGLGSHVVVSGDLNLRYGGSPNAQSCVPSGWYRKGDGSVQHFMTVSALAFQSSASIAMRYTDHVGWSVSVRP